MNSVLAVLGAGNMAGAILEGALARGALGTLPVRVVTKTQASADRYAQDARITAAALETDPAAARTAVAGAHIILIGVKPPLVAGVLDDIAPALDPQAVVISVAAGVTIDTISRHLPDGVHVVRAMPNTPVAVGLGVTGIAGADAEALATARSLFEAVGIVAEVPEDGLDLIGALTGSGPAHVYYLVEQMTQAALRLGMSEQDAARLTAQTFVGAGALLAANPQVPPAELRRRVTSPKGTTERSVAVLAEADLAATFTAALRANMARAAELAAG